VDWTERYRRSTLYVELTKQQTDIKRIYLTVVTVDDSLHNHDDPSLLALTSRITHCSLSVCLSVYKLTCKWETKSDRTVKFSVCRLATEARSVMWCRLEITPSQMSRTKCVINK